MEKRRRRDARNHLRTRSRCPFSLASEYCHPAGGWPFLPFHGVDRVITLLAGQPLRLCGENIDQPLALWQPWAFPGEWALSSVGIVAPWLDFNIMTQRGRASATVQVVSDLQCPASEGVAYVLQGEWDLAGRRCAAGSGLCWRGGSPRNLRPVGSNGRLLLAEIALK